MPLPTQADPVETLQFTLADGIAYVQAGVTHLMKRQREGWAYIRP